jgi:sulfatase maturation enzyme AslB (radical SAM superfamily)
MYMSVEGNYAPCCVYRQPRDKNINYKDMSWNDYYKSDDMNIIRKNMKNGWDPGCIRCQQAEEQGLHSYRKFVDQHCKSKKKQSDLEFIDISLSNECNLRCRMCSPKHSAKWARTLNKEVAPLTDFKKFLEQIDTRHVKAVKYIGGEPFVTPEIKVMFDWAQELPNNVKFYLNTNLTLFPKKHLESLKKFELHLSYSIDGIGSVNNYIRQDSSWDTVLKNLVLWEEFRKENNVTGYVHTSVQAYNFHNLKNIKRLICDRYNLHHTLQPIFSPREFTLNALPPEYVTTYTDDYNITLLKKYSYDKGLHDKLKTTTQTQDFLFKTSIRNSIPQLAKFCNINIL